jgi:hypothetical protein
MRRFLKYVWSVAAFGAFGAVVALVSTGVDATARQDVSRPQPVLHFVGVTAHAWGTWVNPGVEVEDWVEEARGYCAPELFCEVNVFEGAELATHEYPVPQANRDALKWVFTYRHDDTPRMVVEEAYTPPGERKRQWTFEK